MVLLITFSEFREILHLCDNTCTVAGLLPGRTYSFRVKAKNKAGVRHNISELLSTFLNFNTFFQPLDSISRTDGTFGFTLLLVLVLAPILSVLRFSFSHKNLKTKFQLHLETSDENTGKDFSLNAQWPPVPLLLTWMSYLRSVMVQNGFILQACSFLHFSFFRV